MNVSRSQSSATRYALGAIIGGMVGSAATFAYLNVDPFERMVARLDGFPRWSIWQLPFTLPEAAVGAVAGAALVLLIDLVRRRARSVS